ncbi:hypothetical protein BDD12DRAFT_93910 [Trichophaea hybrida]|nr:hypothetical protein BDD12DRAFT_93910 [Trichophaea hybrida]
MRFGTSTLLVLLLSQTSTIQFADASRVRVKRLLDLAGALYGRQETSLIVTTTEITRTANAGTTVVFHTQTAAPTTVTPTPTSTPTQLIQNTDTSFAAPTGTPTATAPLPKATCPEGYFSCVAQYTGGCCPNAPVTKPKAENKTFSNVKIAAVVGGTCGGAIIIALAIWFTYRKVKRRGNTAWGTHDQVAAPTGRAYHPYAPPQRIQRNCAPKFYGIDVATAPRPQEQHIGVYGQHPGRHGPVDEVRPVFYPSGSQEAKYASVPLDSPPLAEATFFGKEMTRPTVELPTETNEDMGHREVVHEVDGKEVPQGRRWSNSWGKFKKRGSGGSAGSNF